MIHRQVSAVFQLRDGFTGRMLPNAGGLLARLDGAPCRPLWKQGGYWVLTDLAPGPHRLELVLAGYRPEPVEWSWDGAAPWQGCVVLKPGQGYPFRGDVTRLVLQLSGKNGPLAHEAVWLCTPSAAQPKLAQDKAQPGDTQLRLYYKGPAAALPVPGRSCSKTAAIPSGSSFCGWKGNRASWRRRWSRSTAGGGNCCPPSPIPPTDKAWWRHCCASPAS